MRFRHLLFRDMKFQARYGFYLPAVRFFDGALCGSAGFPAPVMERKCRGNAHAYEFAESKAAASQAVADTLVSRLKKKAQ